MKRWLSAGRPSPAMLVAVIALVSSLTGGALAAALIDTGDIKNGAVTKKKLHKNSVNSKKVKNKTLKAKDFADGQLEQGVQGIQGLQGPKGEKGEKGDQGDIGPSTGFGASTPDGLAWTGAFQTVQSLTLPAGSYVVNGKVHANNNNAANAIVDCDLRVDGTPVDDGDDLVRLGNNNQPAERLYLVQSAAVSFSAETTVTIDCDTSVTPGTWSDRVLTAVKVGALG
jgi:hypothetical protein